MRNVKKVIVGVVIIALSFGLLYRPQKAQAAYSYYRTITIDHTKVPADQSSFTVLVCANSTLGNSNTCQTVAGLNQSGGGAHVLNASGYDIVFSTDSTCATGLLNWETEKYVASTGELLAWVNFTSISSSTDTSIYMCYGNSAISTFQGGSTGAAWDGNYASVYHLSEATSPYLDSSVNGRNSVAGTNPTQTTGQIGSGESYNGTTQFTRFASPFSGSNSVYTISGWVKSSSANYDVIFDCRYNNLKGPLLYGIITTGKAGSFVNGPSDEAVSTATALDSSWHYVVGTYTGAGAVMSIYVDNNAAVTKSIAYINDPWGTNCNIAQDGGGTVYPGTNDEERISSIARSSNWITTEFNNQSAPGTFETFSSENAVPAGPTYPNTTIGTTGSMFIDSKASVFIQN